MTKEKPTTTIEIPEIELGKIVVTIKGVTPLITNRFGEETITAIENKQTKKATPQRAARDPEAEFRSALHTISEGKYGYPAIGLKKALVSAGGRFADMKMTELRGLFSVVGDLVHIEGSDPEMRRDWIRLKAGISSIAYRPMFKQWLMKVPIVFNSRLISSGQIVNLFSIAGFSGGIGCWRPETNGVFGQFEVEGVETWTPEKKKAAKK